ncbi:unnamed protein product [Parnassius mnemosyne]|uniref:DUF5641 domain-containing protein n=1 Tax=Parnassius mnemosyne TaxID=213953 RepID=A0AAV1L4Y4_9NEOP
MGKQSLTLIELSTIICDCEAIINSRPLTYVATADDSLKPLTPMMFLHPLDNSEMPDLDLIDAKNINIRLQYLNKLRADFRQRFRNEYIALICSKDRRKQNLPKLNDIVLIETDTSRLYWPLGIIKELIIGADGNCRVAKVQTATGELVRAVQSLYPLELTTVTNEWHRASPSTNRNKTETNPNIKDYSSQATLNSDIISSDLPQTSSISTRHGRVINVPRRFLD